MLGQPRTEVVQPRTEASHPISGVLMLIGAITVLRLVYAAVMPLDLVHDEAYYWDWSRNLDFGYYSKPPMIAWLIATGTSLAGSNNFGVRLPAVLLGSLGLIWVYLLGRRMYGHRVGWWAVVLLAVTPGNTALSLLMTIDAPLLFCWSASLYTFWCFLERGPHRMWWLAASILTVGLGILSKQTMLGFLGLAGLFVLMSGEDRQELRRPAIWAWGLLALGFLAPVLWWNHQHGWITLEHTSEHFATGSVSLGKRLAQSGEFLATQLGVVSPLTWILSVGVLVTAARYFRRLGRREWYLLCFSGVPLAGVVVLSLRQRVEPNWPAAFYPAAVVLLVAWLQGHVAWAGPPRERTRLMFRAATVGAVCCLLMYALPFAMGPLGLIGTKIDPAVRLRGWRELGEQVGARFEQFEASGTNTERPLLLVTSGRAIASELAFYMPQQPRVYLWNSAGTVRSQYDIWGGPRARPGRDALIVTARDRAVPDEVRSAFSRVEPLDRVTVEIGNGRRHEIRLWRGIDLQAERTAERERPNWIRTAETTGPLERR